LIPAATLVLKMKGDGVRHNRADQSIGPDDSWLPRGRQEFFVGAEYRRKKVNA